MSAWILTFFGPGLLSTSPHSKIKCAKECKPKNINTNNKHWELDSIAKKMVRKWPGNWLLSVLMHAMYHVPGLCCVVCHCICTSEIGEHKIRPNGYMKNNDKSKRKWKSINFEEILDTIDPIPFSSVF